MGNVTLPTPIFVAGGALCLLAGYFVGSIAGPDTPERTTPDRPLPSRQPAAQRGTP